MGKNREVGRSMKVTKAELSVGLYLAAIVVAVACTVKAHAVTVAILARVGDSEPPIMSGLFAATIASLVVALGTGLFLILPTIRAQLREQGKLRSLAGTLEQRSQHLEQAALTDPLTGLRNRRCFDRMFEEYVVAFDRVGRPVGLLLFDLDKFKAVNDTYGHDVGDEVLKAVAGCLTDFARHRDVVARLGGEEFAIIVTNMSAPGLVSFAERIRQAISGLTIRVGDVKLRTTVSVGLASSEPGDGCAAIFKRADINLYKAKQAGRNRVSAGSAAGVLLGTNA